MKIFGLPPLHDFGEWDWVRGCAGGIGVGFVGGGFFLGGEGDFGWCGGWCLSGFRLRLGRVEGWGLIDYFRPAVVEGFEEFLFGEFLGLKHEAAEIGEGGGSLGLDPALGGGGEETGEGGA